MGIVEVTDEQRLSAAFSLMLGNRTALARRLLRRRRWVVVIVVAIGMSLWFAPMFVLFATVPRGLHLPAWRYAVGWPMWIGGLGLATRLSRGDASGRRATSGFAFMAVLKQAQRRSIRLQMKHDSPEQSLLPLVRAYALASVNAFRLAVRSWGLVLVIAGWGLTIRWPLYGSVALALYGLGWWVARLVWTHRRAQRGRAFLERHPGPVRPAPVTL